jgi:hypothetical protein
MYWSILLIFFSKSKWAWAYHRRAPCSSQLAKIGAERGKIEGKGGKVEVDTDRFLDSRRWAWFLLPPRLSQRHHTGEKPPRPLVLAAPSPCSHRTTLSSSRLLVWELSPYLVPAAIELPVGATTMRRGVGLCGVRIEANYFFGRLGEGSD